MADDNFEEVEDSKGGEAGLAIAKIFGGAAGAILFIPAALFAGAIYLSLRVGKLRPSVIAPVALAICAVFALLAATSSPKESLSDFFLLLPSVELSLILPVYLAINSFVGAIFGLSVVLWTVGDMKKNPHRTKLSENWQYGFKFRRTPAEWFRRKKIAQDLVEGEMSNPKKAPLGIDDDDNIISRHYSEASRHTVMSGTTGSGKTVSMTSLIHNDIKCGKTVFVVDFKNDPKLATLLSYLSKEAGSDFYHFAEGREQDYMIPYSQGQCSYDPLSTGGAGDKADRVLGIREYTAESDWHKSIMRELLQVLFAMLSQADKTLAPEIDWGKGGVFEAYTAASNFNALLSACDSADIREEAMILDDKIRNKSSQTRKSIEELQGQMRVLISSEYGRWLMKRNDVRHIDLFKLSETGGNVVLFSLDSATQKDFSAHLGSLIFSDLTAVSSRRRKAGLDNEIMIYVDEFQAVPPNAVTALLEKSRDSKMSMTLASQSFDQVISSSPRNGEAYLNAILDTVGNFIIHAGAGHDSATRIAKIIGKKSYLEYAQTSANKSTLFSFNFLNKRNQSVRTTTKDDWIVPPKVFQDLTLPASGEYSRGDKKKVTAVVIKKASGEADERAREGDGAFGKTVEMIPASILIAKAHEYVEPEEMERVKERAEAAKKADERQREEKRRAIAVATGAVEPEEPEDEYLPGVEDEEWGWDEDEVVFDETENSSPDFVEEDFVRTAVKKVERRTVRTDFDEFVSGKKVPEKGKTKEKNDVIVEEALPDIF